MNVTEIAGVPVSTDHWIGGQRVSSAATFDDVSPIDGTVIAQVARGGADEAGQADPGRSGGVPGVGRHAAG